MSDLLILYANYILKSTFNAIYNIKRILPGKICCAVVELHTRLNKLFIQYVFLAKNKSKKVNDSNCILIQ